MKRHPRARYSVRIPVTPEGAEPQVCDRADQTEEQLTRWRDVAAGRRRAYELSQWVAAEQARRSRRRWRKGLRLTAAIAALALSVGALAVQSGPDAEARSPEMPMHQEASAELASGVLHMEARLIADARLPDPPNIPVPQTVSPAPVDPEPFVDPPAPMHVGVDHATVTQWTDDEHQWVSFRVETQEPTWIRWLDAKGEPAIEEMPCAFPTEDGHECRAGRSHWRLVEALGDGAASGTWTIEACVRDVCEPVDTVEITFD